MINFIKRHVEKIKDPEPVKTSRDQRAEVYTRKLASENLVRALNNGSAADSEVFDLARVLDELRFPLR